DVAHVRSSNLAFLQPIEVDVPVGCVDDEQVTKWLELVRDEIVDDSAALVGEQRVLRLADADPVEIVGQRGLQELRRARALDLELAHVRDVEDAAVGSYRLVLWDDAFVLDRHLPAGERNHPRAEGDVRVVERRPQERLGHATPMLTRLRKVPLRLSLRSEPQPERLTGSWGQPGRMNPRGQPS